MKKERISILVTLFIIGLIIGLTISFIVKKNEERLNSNTVNEKIISYNLENEGQMTNTYNYVDEENNVVVVGLKENNPTTQEEFYQKVFTSSEIKTIKKKKLIVFEEGELTVTDKRIIKVNNKLYYDTGKVSEIKERCGTMDGKITSHVKENETPTENNQSNFSGDYSYQLGDSNTIEVLIGNVWIIFASEK